VTGLNECSPRFTGSSNRIPAITFADVLAYVVNPSKNVVSRAVGGHEHRNRAVVARNGDFIAALNALDEPREVHLRLRDIENMVIHVT
jgi:hypothetical protein